MLRVLTDRDIEYCGKVEHHDYQLYLSINDIDHTITKAMSPQTNGICERLHKTILNEFYQIVFLIKLYSSLEELQRIWSNEWFITKMAEPIKAQCAVVGRHLRHWKMDNVFEERRV